MMKQGPSRRLLVLVMLLGAAFAALGARLVVLQVVQHEKYRPLAERKRVFLREPRRGDILDINGNPLAISVPVKKLFANPQFLGPYYPEVAAALAPLLEVNEAELARRLKPVVRTNEVGLLVTNSWANLKKKVTLDQWQQITQAMARLSFGVEERKLPPTQRRFFRILRQQSIYAENDQQRVYPNGSLAAHVLGFVQEEESEFNDTITTALAGKYGIERRFNAHLQGVRGWRISEVDPGRREIVIYRHQEVEPRPGLNVVLTIDMVIQNVVETALVEAMKKHSPRSASAMVVRPRTGEILAMAVLPNFDPNRPGEAKTDHLRNRIIADTYEPGSTFKIVPLSGGLNERCIRLTDLINCENGLWHYAGKPLKDAGHGYGVMTVENVVGKSSNIGFAKIGLMLGEERLYKYVRAFGFGSRTDITLDGEVFGLVYPPKVWDKLKITRIPMGQGIAVTQIQMAMAMSAVANEGRLMRPMLVRRLEHPNGQVFAQYEPQMVRQVADEEAIRKAVTALKTVVSTNGTASKAQLEHYTVAGKTGTAQKSINGRTYAEDLYVASFVGFLPADAPELCIAVVIDEPLKEKGYYGGQIAAPTFKAIAEQTAKYLKIRPDREETGNDAIAGKAGSGPLSAAAVRSNP